MTLKMSVIEDELTISYGDRSESEFVVSNEVLAAIRDVTATVDMEHPDGKYRLIREVKERIENSDSNLLGLAMYARFHLDIRPMDLTFITCGLDRKTAAPYLSVCKQMGRRNKMKGAG